MAKVGIPYSDTRAAATSSWVLSGLLAQSVTLAPPSLSVSARFAVSVVTCRQPDRRKPWRGFSLANRSLMRRSTSISRAAHSMRNTPWPARPVSFTWPWACDNIC